MSQSRKMLFIPRQYDPLDENTAHLDGTGRAFEVSISCPDSPRDAQEGYDPPKWTLVEFLASKWAEDAKPRGTYYTCIGCEFGGEECLYLDHDSPPTVVCEESQKFGEGKRYEYIGRRCPRCADDKRRENRTAQIPEAKRDSA